MWLPVRLTVEPAATSSPVGIRNVAAPVASSTSASTAALRGTPSPSTQVSSANGKVASLARPSAGVRGRVLVRTSTTSGRLRCWRRCDRDLRRRAGVAVGPVEDARRLDLDDRALEEEREGDAGLQEGEDRGLLRGPQ